MEMMRCAVMKRQDATPISSDNLDVEGLLLGLNLAYSVEGEAFALPALKVYVTRGSGGGTRRYDWPLLCMGHLTMDAMRTALATSTVNEVFRLGLTRAWTPSL